MAGRLPLAAGANAGQKTVSHPQSNARERLTGATREPPPDPRPARSGLPDATQPQTRPRTGPDGPGGPDRPESTATTIPAPGPDLEAAASSPAFPISPHPQKPGQLLRKMHFSAALGINGHGFPDGESLLPGWTLPWLQLRLRVLRCRYPRRPQPLFCDHDFRTSRHRALSNARPRNPSSSRGKLAEEYLGWQGRDSRRGSDCRGKASSTLPPGTEFPRRNSTLQPRIALRTEAAARSTTPGSCAASGAGRKACLPSCCPVHGPQRPRHTGPGRAPCPGQPGQGCGILRSPW